MKAMHERTAMLIGEKAVEKLEASKVIVFGVGGVGGFATEALARAGVGHLTIVDKDVVSESNLNRQIIALRSTIGRAKVDCMKERLLDINPELDINALEMFYLPETAERINLADYDYVVDAVDTVTAKLQLVMSAKAANVPIISSMGAGSKIHPEMFEIADIYDTSVCPLARIMRRELKKRGVDSLKVVYSKEEPVMPAEQPGASNRAGQPEASVRTEQADSGDAAETSKESEKAKRPSPSSISFTPSAAGLILAGEVVRDLIG